MDDQHVVSAGTRRFSFEWFSSLPSYRSANRAQLEDFLRDVRLPTPWVGIDIACGVGLMSDLCQEVASRIGARLLGTVMIDRDLNALEIAREHLARYPIALLQSLGQSLPLPDDLGSYVVIGNGIHNFGADEKPALFKEAFRVIRHGAGLFFNSAFYDGSVVQGTERFYLETVRRAVRIARNLTSSETSQAVNEVSVKPEAIRQIDASTYASLAREVGFDDVRAHEMVVPMDQELWEAIADYSDYSQGALHHKFPADVACEAMKQATREVFRDPDFSRKVDGAVMVDGKVAVPRRWLWVTARKP